MAEMTIQLRIDPTTGKKDILVGLHSDADLLPHEHEQMHRALVEKLIHGGLVQAGEVGQIVVERVEKGEQAAPRDESNPQPQPRPLAQGQ